MDKNFDDIIEQFGDIISQVGDNYFIEVAGLDEQDKKDIYEMLVENAEENNFSAFRMIFSEDGEIRSGRRNDTSNWESIDNSQDIIDMIEDGADGYEGDGYAASNAIYMAVA